jgi:hypothetical protein
MVDVHIRFFHPLGAEHWNLGVEMRDRMEFYAAAWPRPELLLTAGTAVGDVLYWGNTNHGIALFFHIIGDDPEAWPIIEHADDCYEDSGLGFVKWTIRLNGSAWFLGWGPASKYGLPAVESSRIERFRPLGSLVRGNGRQGNMRRALLVMAIAFAAVGSVAVGSAASPVGASTACGDDGMAGLCVDSGPRQDALGLTYRITQADGPGAYSVYYEDADTGVASVPHEVGPLAFQQSASGTLLAPLNHCYDIHLDSDAGSALIVGPVC